MADYEDKGSEIRGDKPRGLPDGCKGIRQD